MDLVNGVVRDNLKAGVLEPAMSKIKSIKAATEAAIALLRIEYVFCPFALHLAFHLINFSLFLS